MIDTIECMECSWIGNEAMLVSKTDALDDRDFKYCPDCGKDSIEGIDSDDDE